MRQIRKILELHRDGASKRETARLAGVSKNSAKDSLRAAESRGLGLKALLELEDNGLFSALGLDARGPVRGPRHTGLQARTVHCLEELKRRGVTMLLPWEEYRVANPQGYGYTQFCQDLRQAKEGTDLRMHLEHRPGTR